MSGYRAGMFIIKSLRNLATRNQHATQQLKNYTSIFRTPSSSSSFSTAKLGYQFKGESSPTLSSLFSNLRSRLPYKNNTTTATAKFYFSKVKTALTPRYRINGLLRNHTAADYRVRKRPPFYYAPACFAPFALGWFLNLSIVSYMKYETVPYTKRTRLVGMTPSMEKRLSHLYYTIAVKWWEKGKILPEDHPQTLRVRAIANRINEGLQRGIQGIGVWSDSKNCDWEQKFVESLNWEVFVVEKDQENAFCLPGGKIVVYTKLLERFQTDTELATVLGHEMAHAVARHTAESITKFVSIDMLLTILHECLPVLVYSKLTSYLLEKPLDRKLEIEADHIGMLLMASAGYNPRIAPRFYVKLDPVRLPLGNYIFAHPQGERRAELLNESKLMSQALTLYEEAKMRYPQCEKKGLSSFVKWFRPYLGRTQEEINDESDMEIEVVDFSHVLKVVIGEEVRKWLQEVKKDNDMDFVIFTELS